MLQLVSVDELRDDTEFGDIYQDIHGECTKYGKSNPVHSNNYLFAKFNQWIM